MAERASAVRGRVFSFTVEGRQFGTEHERATRAEVSRRLAALKRFDFAGEYDAALLHGGGHAGAFYFVPSDTLHVDTAAALGIRGPDDLFGGVVPHPFVASKVITHPLVHPQAVRPQGWVARFGEAVAGATLKGFSAFSRADALQAGGLLLADGEVRLKPARSAGGKDQCVIADAAALAHRVDALDAEQLRTHGVVLEENLIDPVIHSVGQVQVDSLVASYHGVQRATRSNRNHVIYGGTDLHMVRGDFDALLRQPLAPGVRRAVEQASLYHAAVIDCYPGFFASRINYDVAQGENRRGKPCSGVLEQSWRIGGATGAEIAALEAFRLRKDRLVVRASCVEAYGGTAPPPGATVYFHGHDPEIGPIAKYAFIHPDADPD
ncbi:Protein of unknown function [Variovorax sp. HW608]|uniref:DUF3182 family protein n=1 Tax=Variovorax sp. HW608 TaxID=1034889 RepID=UPI00081FE6A2|nr:DUF3182 family protein [Variovorax sp. HW608]SCK16155.1 Protein of unknown function [Variovorax sp. HW608]